MSVHQDDDNNQTGKALPPCLPALTVEKTIGSALNNVLTMTGLGFQHYAYH